MNVKRYNQSVESFLSLIKIMADAQLKADYNIDVQWFEEHVDVRNLENPLADPVEVPAKATITITIMP